VAELLFSGRAGGRPGCAKTSKGLEVGAILCELDVGVVSAAMAGVAFAPYRDASRYALGTVLHHDRQPVIQKPRTSLEPTTTCTQAQSSFHECYAENS